MNCPVCKVDLVMAERQGVEIDYCPQCRGVWLDRGELDKIVERSATSTMAAPRPGNIRAERNVPRYDDDREYYEKKKKRSFLDDLFDF